MICRYTRRRVIVQRNVTTTWRDLRRELAIYRHFTRGTGYLHFAWRMPKRRLLWNLGYSPDDLFKRHVLWLDDNVGSSLSCGASYSGGDAARICLCFLPATDTVCVDVDYGALDNTGFGCADHALRVIMD